MRIRLALVAVGSAVAVSLLACGQAEMTQHQDRPRSSNPTSPHEPSRAGGEAPPTPPTVAPEAPASSPPVAAPQPAPSEPPTTPSLPPPSAPTEPPAPLPPPPPPVVTPLPPPPPEFSRILWVSTRGSDTAPGSKERPFRTVAKALSLVQPGEAVFLESGTYTERLRLEERGGASGRLLTVKAAPGATPTLKGGTGSSTPMIDVRGAWWRVEGLTVDVAGDRAFAAIFRGKGAHHAELRGSTLKNGTLGAGISVAEQASDVLIEANHIYNFQKAGGGDSHGVVLETTARNAVVRGNVIHHNSGDGVQCIGPEGGATNPGTPFDNLLIEDNELYQNRENGVDIKTCTRVTLRRNTIWGHRRSATSAGEGVVVHLSARDVTLEENVLRGNGRGINVGGVRMGPPPTNIILRRNLVLDGYAADGNDGCGIRVDTSTNVKVQHNTVWNMPGSGLTFGNGDSGPSAQLDVRNNVVADCGLTLRAGPERDGAVVDSNLFFRSAGPAVFRLEGVDMSLGAWRAETGLDGRSLERSPAFANVEADDFSLAPGSPGRDKGVALGLSFCGQAPDLGARESDCP
jgi:nitrous oxidase accessory protein NosD